MVQHDWNVRFLIGLVGERVLVWCHITGLFECHIHFFSLATSADRFYRIDRSQVSFLEPIGASEKLKLI